MNEDIDVTADDSIDRLAELGGPGRRGGRCLRKAEAGPQPRTKDQSD